MLCCLLLFGMKRNVIMVVSINQTSDVFLRSIRRNSVSGDVVVFTDRKAFKDRSIKVVHVDPSKSKHSILIQRFKWYHDFLRKNAGVYGKVIHTDSNDAVFQYDPWKYIPENSIVMGQSDTPIMETHGNSFFIDKCYGEKEYKRLMNEKTVCAGFIGGGIRPFLEFLDVFNRVVLRIYETQCLNGMNFDKLQAGDQAIILKTVYESQVSNVVLENCSCSIFLTEKYCYQRGVTVKKGRIINSCGIFPAYDHQYNHIRGLSEIINL